jgi:hypothetical protein
MLVNQLIMKFLAIMEPESSSPTLQNTTVGHYPESQVEAFLVGTPCSVVVGYQRFGGTCCLRLPGEDGGSKDLFKRWYPTSTLHGVTARKAS